MSTTGTSTLLTSEAGSTSTGSTDAAASGCFGRLRATGGAPILALDVDGVLLDPDRYGQGTWQRALEHRYKVEPEELNAGFFRPHWDSIVTGKQPLLPVLEQALDGLQWPMSPRELVRFWFEADFAVRHDVIDAVNCWVHAGAHAVLLTNQEEMRATFLWDRLSGILAVDAMVYSGHLGMTKEREEFFATASTLLEMLPGTTVVFVDDDAVNVHAARAHGWRGLRFSEACDWRDMIESALRQAQHEAPVMGPADFRFAA